MKLPSKLQGYQRSWLKQQAHHLEPVVSIGTAGLSDAVEKAIAEALRSHELIKIKFFNLKDEKDQACAHIAKTFDAECVSIIGNIGIFYKAAAEKSERIYRLPDRERFPGAPPRNNRAKL